MNRKKKKRKWKPKLSIFKYKVQVPTSEEMVRKLDIMNGQTAWESALKSEMKDPFNLECLDMNSIRYLPGGNYQEMTTVMIIYDV
jgi:translation initiation factor RLI1